MCISIFNELNANYSKRVVDFSEMSTNSLMQIGSRGQESFEASTQIGLWQQQKKLFPCA